jgi:hypothetical protein
MSNDVVPATEPPTGDSPFVRVMTDPDTGRAVIALDLTAATALSDLMDYIDLGDLYANPGYHGLDEDRAHLMADTGGQVRSGLAALFRLY